MIVHRGRLLPSVIVGALVTASLTLGAGVASAAPTTCKAGDRTFEVKGLLGVDSAGHCLVAGLIAPVAEVLRVVGDTASEVATELPQAPSADDSAPDDSPAGQPDEPQGQPSGENQAPSDGGADQARADQQLAADQRAQQEAAQRAATEAAQRAAQEQAARGAVLAGPAAAPGGLAATVPALRFGTPNPALLLVPPGSPLRTLAGQNEGSRVTTTSDVQAIAFDNLPGGMGTPAVVGVLILSTLGAFALRHRILRRARTSASTGS
ncbi:hypothetical protein EV188_109193 [Actinomycetospora succinea]|uniref:Uncharacterized protein n=1 Tax=Actinomycetospora succinea TaxID=663603 RepID=A0A4R6V4C3_9PSEU|nr:hypothetical protein [Actinomycetospora succinea]TDQ50984.1 hypothetical protein EV188_109193 [Actinomycetospora succinea]